VPLRRKIIEGSSPYFCPEMDKIWIDYRKSTFK